LVSWWVARMMAADNPLTEKLALLLHNQFPTAVSKVQFPSLMLAQNELFRTRGAGSFDTLTLAVAKDPAMLVWLDAATDNKGHPNENFARELMERFTMGIGTYTQADVTAAAVCFTGWRFDIATGAFAFEPRFHDDTPQTFLGTAGVDSGEQVIAIATRTPASARWVASRFWSFLAYPLPPGDPLVSGLAGGYGADLSVTNLLRSIFLHPMFCSARTRGGLVKQPVEWVAGGLKALGFLPKAVAQGDPPVLPVLASLGQVPFDPPSVGGWPQNARWLSTASALARWKWANSVTAAPAADLSPVVDVAPGDRVEAVASMLSVDSFSSHTSAALAKLASDPPSLVALALASPEFVAN
ncbi:MAG TPA: DUF1800 family protein, partial [Acidimicrobiales bacterium]|nr:DUF1800 family protein [Acidimicrobiales bacterium]